MLDLASDAGKATGLVTSDLVTGATPATFGASNVSRFNLAEIAQEYIDTGDLDVILGGGRRSFLADPDRDGATTLQEAVAAGYHTVSTLDELTASEDDRLLGLFATDELGLPAGDGKTPSLATMTRAALTRLSEGDDGFFLMVEEERTDLWAHVNEASAVMRAAAAYEDAVRVALDYLSDHPDTLVICVADHETGGMSLNFGAGRTPAIFQAYRATNAEMLKAVQDRVAGLGAGADRGEVVAAAQATIAQLTGGTVALTAGEVGSFLDAATPAAAYHAIGVLLNGRGGIAYATTEHTGVDVSLSAFGAGAGLRAGLIDNTAVYGWLVEAMGLLQPGEPHGERLRGTAGDDRLVGTQWEDIISGGWGDDRLIGRGGDDRLHGGAGGDRLAGRGGDDVLRAGKGADVLTGGAGRDLLEGGRGADVFVFGTGTGRDRIADFGIGADVIKIRSEIFADFDALLAASREGKSYVLVPLGDEDAIRIDGAALETLRESDFIL